MSHIDQVIAQGPFEATWESLLKYEVPAWYEDAKFGIFIHWGLYCVPAFGSEWYPRNMYQEGSREFEHHVKTWGPQAEFGYKDFIPMLTAERYDARAWADLFVRAGAKFVMPVAEHHDGFPLYDSDLTEWCATKMGPKRDLIGELADAVRERAMVFSASSHRAENWWYYDGGRGFESDVQDDANRGIYGPAQPKPEDNHSVDAPQRPDEAFLGDWLARTCEIVDKYQPQVVWFDWWINHEAFAPYLQKFAAYYYNRGAEWGKGVAINYKYNAYPEGSAIFDIERGQLKGIRPMLWQNDTSVSKNSWGYIEGQDYKTVDSIIGDLVDVVSKNGALLLNIGPRADGTIPEPEVEMLLEIGKWLRVNGESVYETRPWEVFGEGPTEVAEGAFTDTKREAFTAEDIRFTRKADTVYATLLAWPEGEAVVKSLGTGAGLLKAEVTGVSLLGHEGALEWTQDEVGLRVTLPAGKPCDYAYVLKVETK